MSIRVLTLILSMAGAIGDVGGMGPSVPAIIVGPRRASASEQIDLIKAMAWHREGERFVGKYSLPGAPGAMRQLRFARIMLTDGSRLRVESDGGVLRVSRSRALRGEYITPPLSGNVTLKCSSIDMPAPGSIVFSGSIDCSAASDTCPTVPVACSGALPPNTAVRAVVRVSPPACSGVLLNNAAHDGSPLLYTARHCGLEGVISIEVGYHAEVCGAPFPVLSGFSASVEPLALDAGSDGALYKLSEAPPLDVAPYYAGWQALGSVPNPGIVVSHPNGEPGSIAVDTNGVVASTVFVGGGIGTIDAWSAAFMKGSVGPGSSGGPLFDGDELVRGSLSAGVSGQCTAALFGRFGSFYKNSAASRWLDDLDCARGALGPYDPIAEPLTGEGVYPSSASQGGLVVVALRGTGLIHVSEIWFGREAVDDFKLVSNHEIELLLPPGESVGRVVVSAVTHDGREVDLAPFLYTPNPSPQAVNVRPTSGLMAGGENVFIFGETVLGVERVLFGGVAGKFVSVFAPNALVVQAPASNVAGPVDITLVGQGELVLPDAYTYTDLGSVKKLGPGLAGTGGVAPTLVVNTVDGAIRAGGTITMSSVGAVPFSSGLLIIARGQDAVPWKGGVLYASPLIAHIAVQANFVGVTSKSLKLPKSLGPGVSFSAQMAFVDEGAPSGVSLTPGLRVTLGD